MITRPFALIALAIATIGIAGTISPGMVDASNMIGYLRNTEHGRRSTSTTYEHPGKIPTHAWMNEAAPLGSSEAGGQIEVVVPDNAGSYSH